MLEKIFYLKENWNEKLCSIVLMNNSTHEKLLSKLQNPKMKSIS